VKFLHGTEDFDSIWATYHWTFKDEGKTEKGEILRRDEWGVLQKVPFDENSTYIILENPLKEKNNLKDYVFPKPEITKPFFENKKKIISEKYFDRFICGYIDPGPFLIEYNLFGFENFFIKLIDNLPFIIETIENIFQFQKELVVLWKNAGAHMINLIDEIAGNSGLYFNPDIWKKHFKKYYIDFFKFVHQNGLYTGLLLDGNTQAIWDDLLEMEIDVFQFVEPNVIGLEKIKEKFKGKKCLKSNVDMLTTLGTYSPEKVKFETKNLIENLNTKEGGFIFSIFRWYRPSYPLENVLSEIEIVNKYRKK